MTSTYDNPVQANGAAPTTLAPRLGDAVCHRITVPDRKAHGTLPMQRTQKAKI
jgi:hypothetical protein